MALIGAGLMLQANYIPSQYGWDPPTTIDGFKWRHWSSGV
jgi:hypothetical protein